MEDKNQEVILEMKDLSISFSISQVRPQAVENPFIRCIKARFSGIVGEVRKRKIPFPATESSG